MTTNKEILASLEKIEDIESAEMTVDGQIKIWLAPHYWIKAPGMRFPKTSFLAKDQDEARDMISRYVDFYI